MGSFCSFRALALAICLGIFGFFGNLFAQGAASVPQPVRLRKVGTACGGYVSNIANTSMGARVVEIDPHNADSSQKNIRQWLETHPDLKDSVFTIVGPPIYGPQAAQLRESTKNDLTDLGYEGVKVAVVRHPYTMIEKIRAFFPLWKSDWQWPNKGERRSSFTSLAMSHTVGFFVMVGTQPWNVAIPVWIVNLAQSSSTTLPRPLLNNWFLRSKNFKEQAAKQIFLSTLFTAPLYWAAKIIADPVHFAAIKTLGGWGDMFAREYPSILFQTAWRTPMEFGTAKWMAIQTERGNEKEGRAASGWLRAIGTTTATQFWAYSAVTHHVIGHFLIDWNWGHVGMGGLGILYGIAWAKPEVLNFTLKSWRQEKYWRMKLRMAHTYRTVFPKHRAGSNSGEQGD